MFLGGCGKEEDLSGTYYFRHSISSVPKENTVHVLIVTKKIEDGNSETTQYNVEERSGVDTATGVMTTDGEVMSFEMDKSSSDLRSANGVDLSYVMNLDLNRVESTPYKVTEDGFRLENGIEITDFYNEDSEKGKKLADVKTGRLEWDNSMD